LALCLCVNLDRVFARREPKNQLANSARWIRSTRKRAYT
jgi:hypothetical protein